MLLFIMTKILLISLIFLFQTNLIAGLEGQGKIELSPYSVEQFEKYLSKSLSVGAYHIKDYWMGIENIENLKKVGKRVNKRIT